jgi:DNA-binding transcriptional LysR family regulator
MRYSPEALTAFVEAVACGSFSAAARRLRKSQSTISTAIANLEADLGVTLFDRATRQPTLTPQGEQVLSYVKAILAASERLDELAISLSGETEARLTFVLSDTLHPDVLEDLLVQFDRRFPHTEFECLIGEDEDVIDLLQKERAQVGLIEAGIATRPISAAPACRCKRRWHLWRPGIRWRRRARSPGMSCIAGASCA